MILSLRRLLGFPNRNNITVKLNVKRKLCIYVENEVTYLEVFRSRVEINALLKLRRKFRTNYYV